MKLDFNIASGEKGRKLARKEFGVGAGDVKVTDLFGINAVHETLEFRHDLNFVQKDIVVAVSCHPLLQVEPGLLESGKNRGVRIFKVDGDNPIGGDALRKEFFTVQFKQGRFAATANACHYFDDILIAPQVKPVDKGCSCDFCIVHDKMPLRFMDFVVMISKKYSGVNDNCLLCYKNTKDTVGVLSCVSNFGDCMGLNDFFVGGAGGSGNWASSIQMAA